MSKRGLANLTDVTLADQATNSMQADNANMAIQGNVAMKVTQSSGQLWNQCKRHHPLHYRLRGDMDKKGAKNWQK